MATPICYVSGGLGAAPSTPLESTHGVVNWNQNDRKVRMVPDADAASILRHNPQDFAPCVFVEEGYGGLTPEQLRALPGAHLEQYTPKGGSDPVDVLVLDAPTLAAIAAAKPTKKPKKAEEK